MDVHLVRAFLQDADKIWKMQVESFMSLYEKYQDTDTSPATEPLENRAAKYIFLFYCGR